MQFTPIEINSSSQDDGGDILMEGTHRKELIVSMQMIKMGGYFDPIYDFKTLKE